MNKLYSLMTVITLSDIAIFSAVYYMITKKVNELRKELNTFEELLMKRIKNVTFSTAVSLEKLETRLKNEKKSEKKHFVKKQQNDI